MLANRPAMKATRSERYCRRPPAGARSVFFAPASILPCNDGTKPRLSGALPLRPPLSLDKLFVSSAPSRLDFGQVRAWPGSRIGMSTLSLRLSSHMFFNDRRWLVLSLVDQRMGRKHPRNKASRPAQIFAGSRSGLPCKICNLSAVGAMLRTDVARWLPTHFQLQDRFTGIIRDVVIVWRGADCVGIRFLDAPSHARSSHRLAFGRRGNT
ncbi:MAG: PilZ domain-containing protein [Hyphomicrobium sp.]|nr:MAG: PilZ domain-containing protein [Hyphomicrobium sp.]